MPLPSLPVELWRAIFGELISERRTLRVLGREPFAQETADLPPHEIEARQLGKRSVVLVCKRWRSIALPMVYEVLVIDDGTRLQNICRALEAESTNDGDGLCGAFIRQIHISGNWKKYPKTLCDASLVGLHIARVIRSCPYLAIFTYRLRIWNLEEIVRPCVDAMLTSPAAHSLRKLDFGFQSASDDMTMWEMVAAAASQLGQLETLVMPSQITACCLPRESDRFTLLTGAMCAFRLRSLVVSWSMYLLMARNTSQHDLPALQEIHIIPSSEYDLDLRGFDMPSRQLSEAGDALNTKLASISFSSARRWDAPILHSCFGFLAQFPNLREVYLTTLSMSMPEQRLRHPSLASMTILLSQLALPQCNPNTADAMLTYADQILEVLLTSDFPRLRRIYIAETGSHLKNARWREKWVEPLGARAITLDISSSIC